MTNAAIAATGDVTIRSTVMDRARYLDWPERYTARVLRNAFTEEWHDDLEGLMAKAAEESEKWIAGWKAGDPERANTFVGEAAGLIHDRPPAAEIIRRMSAEAEALLAGASRLVR